MRIELSKLQYDQVLNHLLPSGDPREFAAFMFADYQQITDAPTLIVRETRLLTNADFSIQKSNYLELSDSARIEVIKKAHSSGRALIELHSHPFPGKWAAGFSIADMSGFRETVPNMLWRLPERPYTAIVVAPSGFDALTWYEPNKPQPLEGLLIDTDLLSPTNQTLGGDHGKIRYS